MMDVSDGLAKDLGSLTPRGTVADLDLAALPLRSGASVRSALSEGEDYELVFTVSARADRAVFESAWHRRFPRVRLACIGSFRRGRAGRTRDPFPDSLHGYEHFR